MRTHAGTLYAPSVEKAFDLSQEPDKIRDAYGRNRVGQSVLLARRLIESGCRFVSASGYRHGQWDTHGKRLIFKTKPPFASIEATARVIEAMDLVRDNQPTVGRQVLQQARQLSDERMPKVERGERFVPPARPPKLGGVWRSDTNDPIVSLCRLEDRRLAASS